MYGHFFYLKHGSVSLFQTGLQPNMQIWSNVFKSWSQVAEEEEPRSLSPLNKRQDHQAVEGLLLN